MTEIELRVPPKVEYLALVRAVVGAAASLGAGIGDERVDDLRLAVSEATTNAIEAHQDSASDEPITIYCGLGADHVQVQVRDRGHGFDPDELVPHPPVTDPERLEFERGLGLPLMRSLTDEHEISPTPNGTTVRLRIYVSKRG